MRKKSLTLLEMMIVIFLIGLIGSVVGFNMKKSMDKAKEFRTAHSKEQIEDILNLELASGKNVELILKNKKSILTNSGLVKDADKVLKDGWGKPFIVTFDEKNQVIVALREGEVLQDTPEDVQE